MNKIVKAVIIIEVQLVVILLILGFFKLNALNHKVFNTNKFIHEVLSNKKIEELKQIEEKDIIIGDENAPLTMFVFTRYGCSACASFYESTYPELHDEYVKCGLLKIVVRQMVHTSKPKILYTSKAAQFAYNNNVYEEFNKQIHTAYPNLKNEFVDSVLLNLIDDRSAYESFISDNDNEQFLLSTADQARMVGIRSTPTFIIGDKKIAGTRSFKQFKRIIESELETESCD